MKEKRHGTESTKDLSPAHHPERTSVNYFSVPPTSVFQPMVYQHPMYQPIASPPLTPLGTSPTNVFLQGNSYHYQTETSPSKVDDVKTYLTL